MSAEITFNASTCDPYGEGEELAKAITDAVRENDSGAIGTMLIAAECLGAEILDMDDDDETLATKIFENDHWRERLNNAIATAEMWIAMGDADQIIPPTPIDVAKICDYVQAANDRVAAAPIVRGSVAYTDGMDSGKPTE